MPTKRSTKRLCVSPFLFYVLPYMILVKRCSSKLAPNSRANSRPEHGIEHTDVRSQLRTSKSWHSIGVYVRHTAEESHTHIDPVAVLYMHGTLELLTPQIYVYIYIYIYNI